jgi:hypothetical protein
MDTASVSRGKKTRISLLISGHEEGTSPSPRSGGRTWNEFLGERGLGNVKDLCRRDVRGATHRGLEGGSQRDESVQHRPGLAGRRRAIGTATAVQTRAGAIAERFIGRGGAGRGKAENCGHHAGEQQNRGEGRSLASHAGAYNTRSRKTFPSSPRNV